jgi:hypothetical protein
MEKTKYQILNLLQKYGIPYAQKGKSFVTRCPFCKGDGKLQSHNAEINPGSATIYCYSEQKLYFIRDLLMHFGVHFGELNNEDVKKAKEKIKENAAHNTELAKATQKNKFDDLKNDLLRQGYTVTGIYEYRNLAGEKEYEVVRFEKPRIDGGKPEKIPIPVTPDGYVGLGNKRQIPYRLEQFLVIQSDEIWLCEGEKCCDAVIAAMPSSANIICLGFRKANDFKGFETLFKNKKIAIFQDNDKTGQTNTENLVEMLKPIAREIIIVRFDEFRDGYDVADFLQDFSWNQLLERIEISERIQTPNQISIIKNGTAVEIQKQEEWILEPFLPTNSIILLDGLGGLGKSIFAMEMAFSISTGQSFLLKEFAPTGKYPILYLTAEETDWRFWERLKNIENAYDMKSENFYWLSTISKDFCLPTARLFCRKQNEVQPTETFVFLENAIKKTQAKLVVLDSWINFYGLDENSTEDGAIAYDHMKSLIRQHNCSIIILHHQTKEAMRGNVNIFRGTMVFREQARARIVMSKWNLPERKKISIEKSNYYSSKLIYFPILVSMSKGVWTIEAMANEFLDLDEEFETESVNKSKKKKKNENGKKCINTVGDEKWLEMLADF